MTDDELKKIEARASAATPGPWCCNDYLAVVTLGERKHVEDELWVQKGDVIVDADAAKSWDVAFITHAREDIPKLIAEVRRLRGARRRLRDTLVDGVTGGGALGEHRPKCMCEWHVSARAVLDETYETP